MAKIVVNDDYLDQTIPQLNQHLKAHEEYFRIAKAMDVQDDNEMLKLIRLQNKMVKAAIKIVKKESKLHNLRLDIAESKASYYEKFGA